VRSRPISLALLVLGIPALASAQSVRGIVRDSAGRPVAEADVIVRSADVRTRTDSSGRFTLSRVRGGRYELLVRKIDFRPYAQSFSLRDGATLSLDVRLDRLPPLLEAVTARVDADKCDPYSIEGFECRRMAGEGMFRDAGQIRALRPEHWADMFDGMPGIRRVMTHGPLGPEWRVAARPSRCLVELWNGQRPMELQNDGLPGYPPDLLWRPLDVIAIEYYDEYKKIPARYQYYVGRPGEQSCELVIYWLRGASKTP
jgi:hypothetical protein